MSLIPYQASIRPHGHNLPRNEFPAGLEGAFRGIFNTAAAWNFHADNGDIPDIIETDDFRQLFRVIHHIQLWTADECDAAGYKVIVEITIGKGGTVSCYREVKTMADELELAFDFCKDDLVTEEEVDAAYQKAVTAVEALELKNMLRQEADQMDCVLKINCGAGGTESQDWASMLMRMYMRWAETNGYKVSVANLQDGDEAGIKTVTMNIEGSFSYGYLKGENGVHRLVRVMSGLSVLWLMEAESWIMFTDTARPFSFIPSSGAYRAAITRASFCWRAVPRLPSSP